jgi:hypothetical protein
MDRGKSISFGGLSVRLGEVHADLVPCKPPLISSRLD